MSNGKLVKELHDLSKQDPKNVPAYTFRQVTLQTMAQLLEEADERKELLQQIREFVDGHTKEIGELRYGIKENRDNIQKNAENINKWAKIEGMYTATLLAISTFLVIKN